MESGLLSKLTICTILMATMAYHIGAAPIRPPRVRLLSERSTRFVAVTSTGEVHAREPDIDGSNDEVKFYLGSSRPGYVSFQSVKYPHLFLIVENDTLTVGEPGPSSGESGSGSSEAMNREEFMEEFLIRHGQVITFFRQQENCYIAFDEEGAVHGPCSLSISDPETRMHMVPVFD